MLVADHDDKPFVLGTGIWGMPSEDLMTTTIIAIHVMEFISVPIGLVLIFVMMGAQLFLGYTSLLQVLVGLAIGFVVHFYQVCTPFITLFNSIYSDKDSRLPAPVGRCRQLAGRSSHVVHHQG